MDTFTTNLYNKNLYNQCKINTPESLDKIIYLINNGANVNFINDTSNTPLHVACFYQCKDIIYYLLENGADHNIKNNKDKTAIDLMIPPVGSYYSDDPSIILRNEIINFINKNK
jgi:ankyrin repeat protein